MTDDVAVRLTDLHKRYGPLHAVDGVSLTIERGETFALLGPNGAGKSTTIEILEGYRRRTSGVVSVLGIDPDHGDLAWKARLGIVSQSTVESDHATVRELLTLARGLYPDPRDVDEVIASVGLEEKATTQCHRLSGGMRRRLDVAMGVVGRPELLFLDEPTTGFDPAARRAAWDMIRSLRSLGKTVLLTTHYLDEAEQLADRVAVMREGVIVRVGTPLELTTTDLDVEIRYRRDGEEVVVSTTEPTRVLHELTTEALARGEELERLEVRRPTLEDVYLTLTGDDAE